MNKFSKFISTASVVRKDNIDTDQIIPARFLKTTVREGLGRYLFYNWKTDANSGRKIRDIPDLNDINRPEILVAGNNFGCGSSREHAVWALTDYGYKAVISSSFGDIFYNNSLKNGLLPVILKLPEIEKLFSIIKKNPKSKIAVDLESQQVISADGIIFNFPFDAFRKSCLLNGVDELGYILKFGKKITDFEKKHKNHLTL